MIRPVTPGRSSVLLIDDQPIVAARLKELLEDAPDLQLTYCQEPAQAVRRALEVKADVVLLDMVMPEVSGLVVLKFFRHHPELKQIPVIMLSSRESGSDKAEAFEFGANDYLVKMPEKVEMLARLRYHCSALRSLRELDASRRDLELLNHKLHERAQVAEALFEQFLDNSPTLACIKSADGRYIHANATMASFLGRADWTGKTDLDFWSEPLGREIQERDRKALSAGEVTQTLEEFHREGRRHCLVSFRFALSGPAQQALLGLVAVDVTSRVEAEEALRQSEERYALAVRATNDGLWDWDRAANIIYYSPRWKEILGLGDLEISADPREWFGRVLPEDLGALEEVLHRHLSDSSDHFQCDFRMRTRAGDPLWLRCRGATARVEGQERMVGSLTDITLEKQAEQKLVHDARHDALTGLPNRAHFLERLQAATTREAGRFAVLFLDLDGFKLINDTLGHQVGDRLLVEVARRLAALKLRDRDVVARLGGDEFTMLIEDLSDEHEAVRVAERALRAMQVSFLLEGRELYLDASIGIALGSPENLSAEGILRDADTAMYAAKQKGKGRFRVFEDAIHKRLVDRLELESELRLALERDQLLIHLQPVVSLASERAVGFEVFVRWQHPERGLLMPADFLPVAEESGLIALVDWLVLQRSLEAWPLLAAALSSEAQPFLSVNMSRCSLQQAGFAQRLGIALAPLGVPPGGLRLEVGESSLEGTGAELLRELDSHSLQLSLDDIRTASASVARLEHGVFSTLKVDRGLVQLLTGAREGRAVVASVLQLARELGLETVASGVESAEQASWLSELGCDAAQGQYYVGPAVLGEVLDWLARGQPPGRKPGQGQRDSEEQPFPSRSLGDSGPARPQIPPGRAQLESRGLAPSRKVRHA